jgi:hypothetical protein
LIENNRYICVWKKETSKWTNGTWNES